MCDIFSKYLYLQISALMHIHKSENKPTTLNAIHTLISTFPFPKGRKAMTLIFPEEFMVTNKLEVFIEQLFIWLVR